MTHPSATVRPATTVVIGAGGGQGAAMVAQLTASAPSDAQVLALGRSSMPPLDYNDEATMQAAAQWVQ